MFGSCAFDHVLAGLAAAGIALVASASLGLVRNICKGKLLQVGRRAGRRAGRWAGRKFSMRTGKHWSTCISFPLFIVCPSPHSRLRLSHSFCAPQPELPVSHSHRSPLPPSLPPCLQTLCTAAAVIAYYYPKPWTFPSLIIAAGLITMVLKRKDVIQASEACVGWGGGGEECWGGDASSSPAQGRHPGK